MRIRELLFRLAKGYKNYRSPILLQLQRLAGSEHVLVRDQRTGLGFKCRSGADRMFGEVFHQRVYDCPFTPIRPSDVVIDIGANHGFASCYFAAQGAHVLAYEPSAEVFRLLLRNISANSLTARVVAMQVAVGAEDGEALLYETAALGGGMSTLELAFAQNSGAQYATPSTIAVTSIHNVLASLASPTVRLIKMDCEGSELAILREITSEERRKIDALAVEFHPQAVSLQELIGVLLRWEHFHLSLPTNLEHSPSVLFAVSERVIRAWGTGASA